jgi:sugar phosphate isomerase/epimerase
MVGSENVGVKAQTSVASSFQYDIPIETQICLVAEAGFSHVSLGVRPEHSGYLELKRRIELKARLADVGLAMDSIHARALHVPEAVEQASATARAAAEFHAPCVVAHIGPFNCNPDGIEERLAFVFSTCKALVPVAKETGVVFALENVMPGPATDLVRRALQDLDPSVFGLCYDSSHDQIEGPRPFDLIDEFRDRIFTVHLSDRIKAHVDHVIPGEGFIAWSDMCHRLSRHITPGQF